MVKSLQKVIAGTPNMGIALNHLGRYDESRKALKKSVGDRPSDSAFNTLGVANYMLAPLSRGRAKLSASRESWSKRYQAWGNLRERNPKSRNAKRRAAILSTRESRSLRRG